MAGKREEAGLRSLTSGQKRKQELIPLRELSLPEPAAGCRLPMLNKMKSGVPSSVSGQKWRRISVAVIFMASPRLNAAWSLWRSGNLSASGAIMMFIVKPELALRVCSILDQKEKFLPD